MNNYFKAVENLSLTAKAVVRANDKREQERQEHPAIERGL